MVERMCNGNTKTQERGKGTEEISETIMTKNFLKLMHNTKPQIQEGQKTLSKINVKKITPNNIISKLQKNKEKVLKEISREKHLTDKKHK